MIKIAFAVYRQWGYEIFKEIKQFQEKEKSFELNTLILNTDHQCNILEDKNINTYFVDPQNCEDMYEILTKNQIDILCLYSWSYIVPKKITDNFICLCLHPSKLPNFRGGTPIQNQVLAGIEKSAVTIFKMNTLIDGGDIYDQKPLSLRGEINDIFYRMTRKGISITKKLIIDATKNNLNFTPQRNLSLFPPLPRRKPNQSELKFSDLPQMRYKDIYNMTRSLLDPYPNAYIKINNFTILLQKVSRVKKVKDLSTLITKKSEITNSNSPIYFKISEGYLRVINYKILVD